MENNKVSYLMTVYNSNKTLKDSIEAILNQTYKSLELVIVNDGSNDGGEETILDYQKKDKRIKFINRKINKGRLYSLNEALKYCTSEFIFINDSDDISQLDRIEKTMDFYNKLSDKEHCGLIGGSAETKNLKTGETFEKINKTGFLKHNTDGKLKKSKIYTINPFVHSSIMYKKSALQKIGGFDKNVTSSIDYFTIVKIANMYNIYTLQDILVTRQITGENFFMQKNITEKNKENGKIINKWISKNVKYGNFYRWLSEIIILVSKIKKGIR